MGTSDRHSGDGRCFHSQREIKTSYGSGSGSGSGGHGQSTRTKDREDREDRGGQRRTEGGQRARPSVVASAIFASPCSSPLDVEQSSIPRSLRSRFATVIGFPRPSDGAEGSSVALWHDHFESNSLMRCIMSHRAAMSAGRSFAPTWIGKRSFSSSAWRRGDSAGLLLPGC